MRPGPIVLAGALLVLAGCGQKGPLYLPDKNAAVVTSAPAAAPPAAAPAAPNAPNTPPQKPDDPDTPAPK